MRNISVLLISAILWNGALAPVAMAGSNPSFTEVATNLVDKFEQYGWRFEDASHRRLSTQDFMQGHEVDVYLVPPAKSAAADYVFHIRSASKSSSMVKYALSVADHQNRVLSRRTIEISSSDDAAAARVRLEQTVTSIQNDLNAQASLTRKPAGLFNRIAEFFVPSAQAGDQVLSGKMLYAISGAGLTLCVLAGIASATYLYAQNNAEGASSVLVYTGLMTVVGTIAVGILVTNAEVFR